MKLQMNDMRLQMKLIAWHRNGVEKELRSCVTTDITGATQQVSTTLAQPQSMQQSQFGLTVWESSCAILILVIKYCRSGTCNIPVKEAFPGEKNQDPL